jgi:hypothetical protein
MAASTTRHCAVDLPRAFLVEPPPHQARRPRMDSGPPLATGPLHHDVRCGREQRGRLLLRAEEVLLVELDTSPSLRQAMTGSAWRGWPRSARGGCSD